MSLPKEFIHKEHLCKKSKSNESGKCPILPDLADIYDETVLLQATYSFFFKFMRSVNFFLTVLKMTSRSNIKTKALICKYFSICYHEGEIKTLGCIRRQI